MRVCVDGCVCASSLHNLHAYIVISIIINKRQVYSILDEYILAGEIQETSKREILERIRDMANYEKMSEK